MQRDPSLISLMIYVDVKHRVYLLTYLHAEGTEDRKGAGTNSRKFTGIWRLRVSKAERRVRVCVCVGGGGGRGEKGLWGVFAGLGTSA